MTCHHPRCIPRSQDGVLIWGHNFNAFIPQLAAKYGITQERITRLTATYDGFHRLFRQRQSLEYLAKAGTELLRTVLNGDIGTAPVLNFTALNAELAGEITTGLLLQYGQLIRQIRNHPDYDPLDGLELGILPSPRGADDSTARSRVTLHRDNFRTRINCTKAGGADVICVHVDRADGRGWQLLGFGTQSKCRDEFPDPAVPVVLSYRVTLYRRGRPLGLVRIATISSRGKK
jgi:hypothetical protein